MFAWASQRQALTACHALSRRQIDALTHTSLRVRRCLPAISNSAGHALLVKR
jgi:hypothetical protein